MIAGGASAAGTPIADRDAATSHRVREAGEHARRPQRGCPVSPGPVGAVRPGLACTPRWALTVAADRGTPAALAGSHRRDPPLLATRSPATTAVWLAGSRRLGCAPRCALSSAPTVAQGLVLGVRGVRVLGRGAPQPLVRSRLRRRAAPGVRRSGAIAPRAVPHRAVVGGPCPRLRSLDGRAGRRDAAADPPRVRTRPQVRRRRGGWAGASRRRVSASCPDDADRRQPPSRQPMNRRRGPRSLARIVRRQARDRFAWRDPRQVTC